MKFFNLLAGLAYAGLSLALLVAPAETLAAQYRCITKDPDSVPIVVEASSTAEAEYKAGEQNPSRKHVFKQCHNISIEQSSDIFVRDARFRNHKHLQPYLPADLKESNKPKFLCDSSGGFLPDGSKDLGNCLEFSSASTRASYKIRFSSQGGNKVWKRDGGAWNSWVDFQYATLKSASTDAQKYAATHGATRRGAATQQDVTNPADTPAPPPLESAIESFAKKGISDALKGFGL